ncbi:leucyl aminopeptidase [Marmoricola sp. Leaf446]|uniref:leucyl aminopeptidase n=1 Tax=Marmoricola sp. Leaf446 TaxID=1736379 RepID=UPI000A88817F|nr:leucyl aminopeptidase [Marmoricola sp. Leaf446]
MPRVTTYTLRKGSPAKTRTDVVVVGAVRSAGGDVRVASGGEDVAAAYGRRFKPLLSSMTFRGEPGETLRVPSPDGVRAGQLLLVGLGAEDAVDAHVVRRAAGTAARSLGNAASVALALPADDPTLVAAVAEGFISGLYSFTTYKSGSEPTAVSDVLLLSPVARDEDAVAALERARTVAEHVDQARDWVNTPPNDLYPETFADRVVELVEGRRGKGPRVEVEVLGPDELAELGCGGILGVGQGSHRPPRLVRLTWAPPGATSHVALVGKGITYDSGGLTIKSGAGMATMKNDMGGAAAVIAATLAIGALGLPVAVTAYAPMAENMPGGGAMRPGDVLTMRDGQTVEVTNTDAEGRLVMADALALAVEQSPDVLLDVATLTGGCVVALGEKVAGLMGDDATTAALTEAAGRSGEKLWRLPIPEESRKAVVDTEIADVLQANWVRWGGTLYAAAFLERFTGDVPWAHLDIAGPAWNGGGASGHVPTGATGYAVTTLVEYAAGLVPAEPSTD